MRALRVELTRLRWRRAVLLLLVAAVVLPALLLAGTAWNSRPITATLAPNTAYWLVYNTNGDNNLSYDTGTADQGAWSRTSTPFGTWPSSFGTSSRWTAKFSIYAS